MISPPAASRASRLARSSSLTVRERQPEALSSARVVGRGWDDIGNLSSGRISREGTADDGRLMEVALAADAR